MITMKPPIIVRDLLATCRALAEAGQTIVVVEQNTSAAMRSPGGGVT